MAMLNNQRVRMMIQKLDSSTKPQISSCFPMFSIHQEQSDRVLSGAKNLLLKYTLCDSAFSDCWLTRSTICLYRSFLGSHQTIFIDLCSWLCQAVLSPIIPFFLALATCCQRRCCLDVPLPVRKQWTLLECPRRGSMEWIKCLGSRDALRQAFVLPCFSPLACLLQWDGSVRFCLAHCLQKIPAPSFLFGPFLGAMQ